jgi:hypothetical protein
MAFDPTALSDEDKTFIAAQQARSARLGRQRLVATLASSGVLIVAMLPWLALLLMGRLSLVVLVICFVIGVSLAIFVRQKLLPGG